MQSSGGAFFCATEEREESTGAGRWLRMSAIEEAMDELAGGRTS